MPPFKPIVILKPNAGAASTGRGLGSLLRQRALWEKKRVQILLYEGETRLHQSILCDVLGNFAVHPNQDTGRHERPGTWNLTHIPTGWRVLLLRTETDARRLGEELTKLDTDLFSQEDPRALREDAPEWLKKWLHECKEQESYLVPPEERN